jgi:hypothetical protein
MSPAQVACDGDMHHCQVAETTSPPCPMHQGAGGAAALQHAASPAPRKAGECAMRAACGNQAAALFTALSQTGVLCRSIAVPDPVRVAIPRSSHPQLILQSESPDAPPPRV